MNTCTKNDKNCEEKNIVDTKLIEEAKTTEQEKNNVLDEDSLEAVVGGVAPKTSFGSQPMGFPRFN